MPSNDADAAQTVNRRSAMRTRVIGLKGDHDQLDREYFLSLSPEEKMTMVWPMFVEQWRLNGGDTEQLKLRRDIACLQRRGR